MAFDLATWGLPLAVVIGGGIGAAVIARSTAAVTGDADNVRAQARREDLARNKDRALAALQTLEAQRSSMTDDDYQTERDALLAQGAAAMRELEQDDAPASVSAARAELEAVRARVGERDFLAAVASLAPAPAAPLVGDAWRGAAYALLGVGLVGMLVWFAGNNSVERREGASMTGNQDLGVVDAAPPQAGGPSSAQVPPWVAEERTRLNALLEAEPGNLSALNDLTQLALTEADLGAAMSYNQQVLTLDPTDADGRTFKGVLSALVGLQERGFELLGEVLADHPDHGKALTYHGLLALELNRPEVAVKSLERVLSVHGDNPTLRGQLARAQQLAASGAATAGNVERAPSSSDAAGPAALGADDVIVSGRLTLAGDAPSGATLFVSVRDPAGGPPLAAIKVPAGAFPMDFVVHGRDLIAMGGQPRQVPSQIAVAAKLDADGDPMTNDGPSSPPTTVARGATEVALTLQ